MGERPGLDRGRSMPPVQVEEPEDEGCAVRRRRVPVKNIWLRGLSGAMESEEQSPRRRWQKQEKPGGPGAVVPLLLLACRIPAGTLTALP